MKRKVIVMCVSLSISLMAQLIHEVDFETGDWSQNPCKGGDGSYDWPACGDNCKNTGAGGAYRSKNICGTVSFCSTNACDCDCGHKNNSYTGDYKTLFGNGNSMAVVHKTDTDEHPIEDGQPVRSGNYSVRCRLTNCHERAEYENRGCIMPGNKTIWIGWSMYIPENFDYSGFDYTIIHQIHQLNSNTEHTSLDLLDSGNIIYKIWGGSSKQVGTYDAWKGKWMDMVLSIKFSTSAGFFKFWVWEAGTTPPASPDFSYTGNTGSVESGGRMPVMWTTGMYRGHPGHAPVPLYLWIDEYRYGLEENGIGFQEVSPPGDPQTGVQHNRESFELEIPGKYQLDQNYPNPYNSRTVIKYQIPQSCHVRIRILTITGQAIKTLVNSYQNAGIYRTALVAELDLEPEYQSGLYLYTIEAGSYKATRKMLLLK